MEHVFRFLVVSQTLKNNPGCKPEKRKMDFEVELCLELFKEILQLVNNRPVDCSGLMLSFWAGRRMEG